MNGIKRIPVLALILVLTACGGRDVTKDVTTLVQGNLDELYLGKFSEEYMALVGTTQEECEQDYEDSMETEAEYFQYYFDIDQLTDEMHDEVVAMYKEVYASASYTISAVTQMDENTYAVKVEVQPINLFQLVGENWEEAMAAFNAQYTEETLDEISYEAYDEAWARMCIDLCRQNMPDMGYLDTKTIAIQVVKDDNDYWSIASDDFDALDELVIDYS